MLKSHSTINRSMTNQRATMIADRLSISVDRWPGKTVDAELNWLVVFRGGIYEVFISDDYCGIVMKDTRTGVEQCHQLNVRVSYLLYPIEDKGLLALVCQDKKNDITCIVMFDLKTDLVMFMTTVVGELSMSVSVIDVYRNHLILISSDSLLSLNLRKPTIRTIAKVKATAGILIDKTVILYNKDEKRLMAKNIKTGAKESQLNISKLDVGRFVCIRRTNKYALVYFQGHNTPIYEDGRITLKCYAYQSTLGKSVGRHTLACLSFECLNIPGRQLSIGRLEWSAVIYQTVELSICLLLSTVVRKVIVSRSILLYNASAVQSVKCVMVRRVTYRLAFVYLIDEYDADECKVYELKLKI